MEKNEKFSNDLVKAYSYLKEKNIKKAISFYNKLNLEFSKSNEQPKKLKNDIMLLYSEINLYLRINELYLKVKEGNFEVLNLEMQRIHDFTHELRTENYKMPLIENKDIDLLVDIYKNAKTEDFNKKHAKIINLIDSNINKAIYEFSNLIIIYNKLFKSLEREERLKIYSQLKTTYRNISINKFLSISGKFPKQIYGKKIEKSNAYEIIKRKKEENKVIFKDVYDMVRKQDYSKAIEFYENL